MELHDRLFVAKEIGEAFAYFRERFSMELRENGLRAIQHLEEEEVQAIQQSVRIEWYLCAIPITYIFL